ncbi:hypothetical protein [Mesoflavibacter sp. SCSIO 43206]|uniref:hypothetical protein n=1 Tax=Mesoflavibacter sp. SCSIO 43206 TaxID=2779362 RepID=UPI001CA7C162|nr:hypothetical protein [Mesoflavibacter sp. SCSIO 43206]UAB76405.1 hypothetical protein INR78_05275 [Mesoflavibacter sp. SCSIO 43206]
MKLLSKLFSILFIISVISCKTNKDKKGEDSTTPKKEDVFNDSIYVMNPKFPVGDVRRYGLTAETAKQAHPKTGKNRMTTVLDLAEASGIEMTFPGGYYGMDLTLDSRKNLKLKFNKSEFSLIHITQVNDSLPIPENITLKGSLIAYARLGITEAKNIKIDSVFLKTDEEKNLYKMRNTGCHIYHGCKNITINYLEVDDLGSGSNKYKYTHAAIAMDGWNNNPTDVTINKAVINSTDRHGVYMTGQDNIIKDLTIKRFGVGSVEGMDGMQDAAKGEEKELTAVWLNKCDYCYVDKVTIDEKDSKAANTFFLDTGNKDKPSEIGNVIILNDNPKIEVKKEENTNVQIVSITKK